MKIKKLLLTIFGCTVALLTAYAQDDYSWYENPPTKYLSQMTQMIISADSPCNINGEAFKDFIPRFRKEKAFRDSRLKFNDEMHYTMFEFLADWNNGNGYALLKASQRNQRCDKSYGTWFNVSADEVCFAYDDVLLCSEFGGSSLRVRFQRIDGKWYCTGIMMAG